MNGETAKASGTVRRFVRSLAAVRAPALVLATALLAGAALAGGPPRFTPEQVGGTIHENLSGEPQTLNPLTAKDLYARIIQDRVLESLIDRDPDTLQWRAQVADRWEISPDGLTITFHLDPRAKFSDNVPVTADDVLFTYETIMNPKVDAREVASYFEDCRACEKVDDRTVRFIWKKPYFKSLETSNVAVIPKHVYQFTDPNTFNDMSNKLVGSGPYRFKDWKTGQHLVLERNENYWGERPAVDDVVFRFILEEQAEVQALLAGEVDDLAVSPEWWVKLRERPEVVNRFQMLRYTTPFNGYSYVGWNNARPLFADRRVRRALTQLVWREQVLKYLLYGIGSVATGPFWPQSPQCDPGVKPWPFDREAARQLLREAGWEDRNGDGWLENAEGKRFEFEFSSASGHQVTRDMVRVIGEEFRRMGIDMHVRLYEWSVFTVKLDNRDFDAIMLAWGGGGVEDDPFQIWDSKSVADRGSNFISFRNAEADRLIEAARMTLDEARRNELYHAFHRLVHDEQPYTFMFARESLRVISPRIKGVRQHRLGLDWRDWWIAKDASEDKARGGAAP